MEQSTCQQIRDQLHAYRAGEVSPLARQRIEQHIDGCDFCGAELWLQRELEDAAKAGPPPLGDAKKREILAAVHSRTGGLARRPQRSVPLPPARIWAPALAAAACAVAAFVVYSGNALPELDGWLDTGGGVQAFAPEPAHVRFRRDTEGPALDLRDHAVLVKFDRPPGSGALEVRTPQATVVVRGTVFFVDVVAGRTVVGVQHGTIEVVTSDGASERVSDGQQLSTDGLDLRREAAASARFTQLDSIFPPPQVEVPPAPEELPPAPLVHVPSERYSVTVSRVVRKRLNTVRECYQHELKNETGLAGNVDVEIVIDRAGRVSSARISGDTVGSDTVAACIIDRVKRWTFPPPDGGAVAVTIPFVFTLAGGAELEMPEP